MVDDDLKESLKGGGDSSSSGSSSSDSGSTSGGGTQSKDAETFHLEDDAKMDASQGKMFRRAESMAEDSELNFDSRSGESKGSFIKRQVAEVKELHESMVKHTEEHISEGEEEMFTLVLQAVYYNFVHNRRGIAQTLEEDFGMSPKQAYKKTNEICHKAGEKETLEEIVDIGFQHLMGL